jgi:hypothetical protein
MRHSLRKRAQDCVHDALRRLNIAASYGCGWTGVHQRTRRRYEFEGSQDTFRGRRSIWQQAPEDIQACGKCDGANRVNTACYLIRCSRKINLQSFHSRIYPERDDYSYAICGHPVVIEEILCHEFSRWKRSKLRANKALGILKQLIRQIFEVRRRNAVG